MKAEIIGIGTELLLGQIANTNAQFISEQLALIGIPVYYHGAVGDNPQRLRQQLEISSQRSNLIIMTGGLGPTKDDLTKQTVADFLNRDIVTDEQALEQVLQFFKQHGKSMTDNNKRQAEVIEGAEVFQNTNGLAPGMAVTVNEICYILLPGPPKEVKPMVQQSVTPYLQHIRPDQKTVFSKVMRFCGIGESTLEAALEDLIDQQTSPTIAPLAKEGEVTLRLTSFATNQGQAEQEMSAVVNDIQSRVGQYLYGWDEDTLEHVLYQRLASLGLTVAIAESCTGGLLSSFLTRLPGISDVFRGAIVTYTNEMKSHHLGVSRETIEEYGAISEQTAKEMAQGVQEACQSSVGLSITGVAGPSSQEDQPVGLVYIGIALPQQTVVKEVRVGGQREAIQHRASKLALFYLFQQLQDE
ncbi:competence/damage-inducible protein A [Caldalkalibacillus salinus]|uniref:competence/damage-inducible protein A n=1 Tax=Caldalkalibacillus salinus TaxID=2803787 RepID=UPI001921F89D